MLGWIVPYLIFAPLFYFLYAVPRTIWIFLTSFSWEQAEYDGGVGIEASEPEESERDYWQKYKEDKNFL